MAASTCPSPEQLAAAVLALRLLIEPADDDRPAPPAGEAPPPRPWPVVVTP